MRPIPQSDLAALVHGFGWDSWAASRIYRAPWRPISGWSTRNKSAKLIAAVSLSGLLNPARVVPGVSVLVRRRLAHHDVTRPLQILDQPLGGDLRYYLVRAVHASPAVEPQGEGAGLRQFVPGGGAEIGGFGHGGTVGGSREPSKNFGLRPERVVGRPTAGEHSDRARPNHDGPVEAGDPFGLSVRSMSGLSDGTQNVKSRKTEEYHGAG